MNEQFDFVHILQDLITLVNIVAEGSSDGTQMAHMSSKLQEQCKKEDFLQKLQEFYDANMKPGLDASTKQYL